MNLFSENIIIIIITQCRFWSGTEQHPMSSHVDLDTLLGLRVIFLRTWCSAGTSICRLIVLLVLTGDDALDG